MALLDESSEAAAIALFGAAIAGVPYVPLNYRLADADLAALTAMPEAAAVIGAGPAKTSIRTTSGLQVDLRVIPLENSP